MRRLVVEYWVCNQLFSSTNFFNVFNAFPLSNDSRAMATHSSIGLAGSMACMAKEALISTQSVWALVALFSSTLLKIFDASSGVFPPIATKPSTSHPNWVSPLPDKKSSMV